MPIYRPDTRTDRVRTPNTFANIIVLTVIYFTFRLAFDLIWPSTERSADMTHFMVSGIGWSFLSAIVTVLYAKLQLRQYELWLEDDAVRVKAKWFDRSVRKGEIRTMVERRDGLLISSRGRVGLFFCGGVLISRMLPEYDELQDMVESWKAPGVGARN
jgi:hypothetical protein